MVWVHLPLLPASFYSLSGFPPVGRKAVYYETAVRGFSPGKLVQIAHHR